LSLDPRGTGWPRLLSGADGDWSREPLPFSALTRLNFDLRLSTNALRLGQIAAGDAALTAMAKDGRAEISFASTRSYDGALKARLSLHTDTDLPRLRAHIQFDKLDAAGFLRDALTAQRIAVAGTASGEME